MRWEGFKLGLSSDICHLEIEEIESTIPWVPLKLNKFCLAIVQVGNRKYRLGEKGGLSELEVQWLATELSQWLGVEIKRTFTKRGFMRL